jgi:hypothetical protein
MKLKITSRIAGVAVVATYCVLSALPAFGADSGTVSAKVTVAAPCITVNGTAATDGINFGTRAFSTPTAAVGISNADTTLSNCAALTENIYAKGTDAAGPGATWTLVDARASNPCTYGIDKYGVAVPTLAPGNVALTTPDQLLGSAGPGAIPKVMSTLLAMPCTGSSGAGQTMNFQVVYTASL